MISKCPLCGSFEFIEFVFAGHQEEGEERTFNNPSDINLLRVCPKSHIYDPQDEDATWELNPLILQ